MMDAYSWVARALSGEAAVWDIGQLDKPTVCALNKLVRQGRLTKNRARWCGISPLKSIYYSVPYDFAAELENTKKEMALAFALDALLTKARS